MSSGSIPASSKARRTPISDTQAPAATAGDHRDALAGQRADRPVAEGRQHVGRWRRGAIESRNGKQGAAGTEQEARIGGGPHQLDALADPAEAEQNVVEVEVGAPRHHVAAGFNAAPSPCSR